VDTADNISIDWKIPGPSPVCMSTVWVVWLQTLATGKLISNVHIVGELIYRKYDLENNLDLLTSIL